MKEKEALHNRNSFSNAQIRNRCYRNLSEQENKYTCTLKYKQLRRYIDYVDYEAIILTITKFAT